MWLQYAECLNSLGELDEAARAFQQVLEQVPTHNTARLALSAIQHQLGNPDEAISVLQSGATVVLLALCGPSMFFFPVRHVTAIFNQCIRICTMYMQSELCNKM